MAESAADRVDLVVEQWRRARPDLDTTPFEVLGRLMRAAQLIDRRVAAVLEQHGLEEGWFDLLSTLRRAGEPFELSPTQLMEATVLTSGGMTKRLDRLEAAGLVRRAPNPEDRRGVKVRLTAKGRRLADRAIEAHLENEAGLIAHLGSSDRHQLEELLRRLLVGLERTAGGAE